MEDVCKEQLGTNIKIACVCGTASLPSYQRLMKIAVDVSSALTLAMTLALPAWRRFRFVKLRENFARLFRIVALPLRLSGLSLTSGRFGTVGNATSVFIEPA